VVPAGTDSIIGMVGLHHIDGTAACRLHQNAVGVQVGLTMPGETFPVYPAAITFSRVSR